MQHQSIPVAKLSDFFGPKDHKRRFIQTVGDALAEIGFFALEEHGIEQELINQGYVEAKKFFSLPAESKQAYEISEQHGQRGFTSFGKEHAKDYEYFDLKEFWHVGRPESNSIYPANIWPKELPNFSKIMSKLYTEIEQCTLYILEACSLYLGEQTAVLREIAEGGNSILRIIHYPPIPQDKKVNHFRAAAHEDINLITLLCEATAEGLELKKHNNEWLPIHAIKGQVIIDAGDMLQNITNGFFRSTTHRVINPDNSREERFSIPFFCHPRSEVSLDPLASCIAKTGGKKIYRKITAGNYLNERLAEIGLKNKLQ